jgi:hypothetical protein
MKCLPHVIRNTNEFNVPSGTSHGYHILYFGVNLILMLDYRLSFEVEVKNRGSEIEVLIISRKDTPRWKNMNNSGKSEIGPYYTRRGIKINDVFRPTISDAYAFIVNNSFNNNNDVKMVEVTLIHNWLQEVKDSQLKDCKGQLT